MGIAESLSIIPVADYLRGEESATSKHEYLNGVVYAMAGASNRHNRVAGRVLRFLGNQMEGNPCEPFNSDTKLRIRAQNDTRFYYPDGMVVCEPNPDDDHFQDRPALVIEVLSESTRRNDEIEKKEAYLKIPSLQSYILLESDRPRAVIHRRTDDGFAAEVHTGTDSRIELPEIDATLDLSDIYG